MEKVTRETKGKKFIYRDGDGDVLRTSGRKYSIVAIHDKMVATKYGRNDIRALLTFHSRPGLAKPVYGSIVQKIIHITEV